MIRKFLAYWLYNWAIIQRYRGLRRQKRKRFEAAERYFTRALKLNENHIRARVNRGLVRWRELDDWAGAIKDFTTLLEQQPDYHLARFYRGMAFHRGGNYQAAAQDLYDFIRLAPKSRWAYDAQIQLDSLYAIIDDLPKLLTAGTSTTTAADIDNAGTT